MNKSGLKHPSSNLQACFFSTFLRQELALNLCLSCLLLLSSGTHMCTAVLRRRFLVDLTKHLEQDWVLGRSVFVRLCHSVFSGRSTSFNSLVTHKSPSHSTYASVVGIIGLLVILGVSCGISLWFNLHIPGNHGIQHAMFSVASGHSI